MGDHPILFSSEEDVLTPGWHSWCVEDYAGGGDSRNDFFYTAITVGSSFRIEQQLHNSFELTCQPPPVRCELLAQMGAYLDGSD
jgi:hypothetical protein